MITKAQQAEISSKNLQMVLAAMTAIISTLASVLIIYLQVSNNSVASRERAEIKIDLKAAEIKADSKVEVAKNEVVQVGTKVESKLDAIQKTVEEKSSLEIGVIGKLDVIHSLVNSDMLAQKKISMDFAKKVYDLEKSGSNKEAYEIAKEAYDEHAKGQKETDAEERRAKK